MIWLFIGGIGKRGTPGSELPHPEGELRTGAEIEVGFLCPLLPHTAPFPPAVVVHLGRKPDDSDTSFPSRASIFFTTTFLKELVLMCLKEPGSPPQSKLAWKPTPLLRFQ